MTALSLKQGVSLRGVQPQVVFAIHVAHAVYAEYGYACIVTSCTDGKHSRGSLHYVGYAVDFRTRHIMEDDTKQLIADLIRQRLGDEYDVVHEPTHIHVEYQPKQ